jgi:hypothetical protein
MTKHKVIRIFSCLIILAQLAIGIWAVVYNYDADPHGDNFDFFIPLENGLIIDIFFGVPVFIVSVVFMIWDKSSWPHYIIDVVLQLFGLVAIPYIFSMIIH